MTTRADIVRVARSYIGTPFAHAQRVPGVGMDCAGVPICAWRDLGVVAPDFDVPPYTQSVGNQNIIVWCDEHLERVDRDEMQPGDLIVIAVESDPQHIGVLGDYVHGGFSIIHAANNAQPPRVIETRLMFSRSARLVEAYDMRGVA